MTFVVTVQNDARFPVDTSRLQQAAQTVLVQQAVEADSTLTIVITSDEAQQALNKQHRKIDAPTDVLSFPADPLPSELSEDGLYLGDLIIAFPYANSQAKREGHALGDSLALLVIHGTLHLLGYDHDTPENRRAMWAAQATALKALGIDETIVPALENNH
ncbi:MAG: rRNA maturation RNase YbeY [Anaerolineae bacterium]|nr:rRNA maturation RNase YbeY [Anaerolineae bacterium]MDQ7033405.1 rRNA maturation RNase YbeY [Anaerolineae bacterium]